MAQLVTIVGADQEIHRAVVITNIQAVNIALGLWSERRVGGDDDVVLELNRDAYEQLTCEKRLTVVPGASHLFEEPGTLEAVARLACEWCRRHLAERVS